MKIYKKPTVIAEIGCNHMGSMKLAKKLIKTAKYCGADYVKCQKRNNKYLLGDKYNDPHPVKENSFGKSYGLHRDFLEFNISEHIKLINYCKKLRIKYAVSVWEKQSAEEFIKLQKYLDYIKVPSACNTDFELLEILANKFKKKIHVSLGMTKKREIEKNFNFFKKKKRSKDIIIYQCCSSYPARFEDLNLLNINRYLEKYKKYFKEIGYSGHHLCIAADIAAYTLGANIIERHFTIDRTLKGTDHAASLEPDGLKKLCRDLNSIFLALKYNLNNKVLTNEVPIRKKLKIFRN